MATNTTNACRSGVSTRPWKTKRLIIFGVLAVLVIAYIISIVPNFRQRSEWKKTVSALRSLPLDRVATAAQAFVQDRKASGSAVPAAVPLRELTSGGYLRAEDIRGLEGRDVIVALTADETTPQTVWICVRAADGFDTVLMADGSIQQLRRR